YASLTAVHYLAPLIGWHVFMSIAALATAAAQPVFLANLIWSFFHGVSAAPNPWEATTLEWTVSSPPPWNNFPGKLPAVRRYPYEYGVAHGERDYVMQDEPPPAASS
ncbi:MAG TPA: cytochrome c oxidase subunit I, partial [Terriglobia bacterium]|nr:cytochrome c oxidase subunit I [Terriglobia bacterium]